MIIQIFLDKGFSVNATQTTINKKKRSITEPLIVRVASANISPQKDWIRARLSLRLLLDRGVDIDAVTSKGETTLLRATRRRDIDCVKRLLIGGANPFLKAGDNLSPLELAIKRHYCEHVKEFLDVAAARGYQYDEFLSLIPSQSIEKKLWEVSVGTCFRTTPGPGSWADFKQRIEGCDNRLQCQVYWERFFIIKEMKRYYWRKRYPLEEDAKHIAAIT